MSGCKIGKVKHKLRVVEPFPYPINGEAVSHLEWALEQAKIGEFRSIGICAINARGYVTTGYSMEAGENPVLLSGAASWLVRRINKKVDE